VFDDAVVYLGLSDDVKLDLRAAAFIDGEEDVVVVLRKTRAGGNWLTGGIV
jgi:hypothetical protein